MSPTFREPSPGEIQAALIQFMGQNLGEIKKLDSHIIDKNSTLQGLTLQPEAVLRSIPVSHVPPPPPPPPPPQQIHLPTPVIANEPVQTAAQQSVETADPNQLVFDFISDLKDAPSLKDSILLIEKKVCALSDLSSILYRIEKKLDQVIDLTNVKSIKKKADQDH